MMNISPLNESFDKTWDYLILKRGNYTMPTMCSAILDCKYTRGDGAVKKRSLGSIGHAQAKNTLHLV